MKIYLDTSALIKRVVDEAESGAVRNALRDAHDGGSMVATSVIARVEVSRVARVRLDDTDLPSIVTATRDALAGVAIAALREPVIESARIIGPPLLRSLDAIHLATAVALGVDELWTYDVRMARVSEELGIPTRMPA